MSDILPGIMMLLGGGLSSAGALASLLPAGPSAINRARRLLGWDAVPVAHNTPADMLALVDQLD